MLRDVQNAYCKRVLENGAYVYKYFSNKDCTYSLNFDPYILYRMTSLANNTIYLVDGYD
jgi:hypothetical protein